MTDNVMTDEQAAEFWRQFMDGEITLQLSPKGRRLLDDMNSKNPIKRIRARRQLSKLANAM